MSSKFLTLRHGSEKMGKKKNKLGFVYLQEACDNIKQEALWPVLMLKAVGKKRLNGIRRYVDIQACVRIIRKKENEWLKIDIELMMQGWVGSPRLLNLY